MAGCSHLTDRERDEATRVTTTGGGHQYEIQLGHLCNNRCVFCSSGQLTEMKVARHIPLEPMIAALDDAKAAGARRITFLGGEPTLHKGFLAALAHAVDLGFEEIVIFTNGVLLPKPGFIDSVVALGHPFEWRISIQGGDEAAHVAVTGREDSFRRIVEGLGMLAARGQKVTANICVNEASYRSLPKFPDLVAEHGIRQLHLDVIRPSSAGERPAAYLREIMPRYSDMAPYFDEMLEGFEAWDPAFDVNVGNLPFCILPRWAHRIHHGGEETITKASNETELEAEVDKYAWHFSMRRHPAACEPCVFRPVCSGVYATYLALWGEEEFEPVSRQALADLAHADRHFPLLSEPWLLPLREAGPPPGFGAGRWHRNTHDGWVEVYFQGPGGAASLRFVPRVAAGPPPEALGILETDRYRMTVVADLALPEAALVRLLSWAASRLAAVPEVEVVRPLDIAAFATEHRLLRRRSGALTVLGP